MESQSCAFCGGSYPTKEMLAVPLCISINNSGTFMRDFTVAVCGNCSQRTVKQLAGWFMK